MPNPNCCFMMIVDKFFSPANHRGELCLKLFLNAKCSLSQAFNQNTMTGIFSILNPQKPICTYQNSSLRYKRRRHKSKDSSSVVGWNQAFNCLHLSILSISSNFEKNVCIILECVLIINNLIMSKWILFSILPRSYNLFTSQTEK